MDTQDPSVGTVSTLTQTPAAFQRLWKRLQRRVERFENAFQLTATPIETLEHNWIGVQAEWDELTSTEAGQRLLVEFKQKISGEYILRDSNDPRVRSILTLVCETGHGTLTENILQLHDKFDPTQQWRRQQNGWRRTPLEAHAISVMSLKALAKRAPQDIPKALDVLLNDLKEIAEHNDYRDFQSKIVLVETWLEVAKHSTKEVRNAMIDWIRSGPDLTVGDPQMQEALDMFVGYIKVRALKSQARQARPKQPEQERKHTPKL